MTDHHTTGAILDPATILALIDRGTRPNSAIRAAADYREHLNRTTTAETGPTPWRIAETAGCCCCVHIRAANNTGIVVCDDRYAGHFIINANPDYITAACTGWRNTASRHTPTTNGPTGLTVSCDIDYEPWPCTDLTDTLTEVRAWLTGTIT